MGLPKRKNNIKVYGVNAETAADIVGRRKELLERITKSDTFLPDSILHDDLDLGMLEFVKSNFKVISDSVQIPIVPQILTIQRWGEYTNNWSFSDEDGNIKLPFIAVIRKPDVQFGTNPAIQRTIPDRRQFFYATVPTWDGNQMGADVYKIPQPIAVDIGFEVTIVCTKFRDLNKFNKIVMEHFSSRQAYTTVKGHYIPIVLDRIEDNTPMDTLDGRRFYVQNYSFTMLGFLIDDEEFEVMPAVNRSLLMTEVDVTSHKQSRPVINLTIDCNYTHGSIIADYTVTANRVVDKTVEISFTDILGVTSGSVIQNPVILFLEHNQISGSTTTTIDENYDRMSLQSTLSGFTLDVVNSKYDYNYTINSNFEPVISQITIGSNSIHVRILNVKINDIDVSHLSGDNFILYSGDTGTFTTDQTGTKNVKVYYSSDNGTKSLILTDSTGTTFCTDTLNGDNFYEFNSVVINNNGFTINAETLNC